MSTADKNCTVIFYGGGDKGNPPNQDEILKDLESPKVELKVSAIKRTIQALLNGENLPRVLMHVIRFCSTNDNHQLKKLLMIYWEVVQKYDSSKKLLPEMILVCNALLNDLNHPNEYIRGCMLRFLCKIKEPELLEPLKDAIKSNLEHRHSYVRRNAVMTVFTVYKNFGEQLIPDAPELIERFIVTETDTNARRNAFLMLFETAQGVAVNYLMNNMDQVGKFGDGFSLVIMELTRKVCRQDPTQKARFIRCIFQLLNSSSPAVSYEAAWTLVALSSAPTAVRAAAMTYAGLLNGQSDNNIKLIVLERLSDLKKYHSKVLQEVLMDIMRALSSPNIDICKRVLDIAMDLINPRNIEEVVQLLKREVLKTQDKSMDKSNEYRQLLIQAIHTCAVKFPDVANQVVYLLMEFLSSDGAMDVILFVRSICQSYPDMRPGIINKLMSSFSDIKTSKVYRVAVWIIGEFCDKEPFLTQAYNTIKDALGTLPFTAETTTSEAEELPIHSAPVTRSVVLADGTYSTESVYRESPVTLVESVPSLRKAILTGDFFLGSAIASALTKLGLRFMMLHGASAKPSKAVVVESMLFMCGMIIYGQSSHCKSTIAEDARQKITMCLRVLSQPSVSESFGHVITEDCRSSYAGLVAKLKEEEVKKEETIQPQAQPDDLISFRQLRGKKALGSTDIDIDDGADISRAAGSSDNNDFSNRLNHVHQLTGFADPVYGEAYVTVHDYDIVLEILVINRTPQTLTNLTVELSTMGDLKLVERPQSYTVAPLTSRVIKANIKVSSTETGHIFGTIVYDSSSSAEKTYINLNDIHLDIMDYIVPATCLDSQFRSMWAEFEWENKVAVNTQLTDITKFLYHIATHTRMRIMTPISDLGGETMFLAANLYAKSIFGEDALVNVSVEKHENGKISGYIRIRSKTQGIALSLGDRISAVQRGEQENGEKITAQAGG